MMDRLAWIFVVCMLVEFNMSQNNDCTGSQGEVDFCRFNRTECYTYSSNLYRLSFSTADLTENGFCSCRLYSNELFSIHIKYVEITTPGYRDNAAIYEVCEPYQRRNANTVENDTILNDISEIGFSLQRNDASGTSVYVNLVGAYLFEVPEPSSARINVSCNRIQLHEMNECYMTSDSSEEENTNSSSENSDSDGLLVTVIIVVVVGLILFGICICGICFFLRRKSSKKASPEDDKMKTTIQQYGRESSIAEDQETYSDIADANLVAQKLKPIPVRTDSVDHYASIHDTDMHARIVKNDVKSPVNGPSLPPRVSADNDSNETLPVKEPTS